jgi:hypothetical protein
MRTTATRAACDMVVAKLARAWQCFNSRGCISAALGAHNGLRELKNSASSSCRGRTRRKKLPGRSGLVCDQTICARGGRRRTGRRPAPSLAAVLEGILVPDLALAWPRPGIEHGKPQEAATGEVDDSRIAECSARLGRSPPQAVDETPFDRNGASSRGGIIAKTPAQFQEQEPRLERVALNRSVVSRAWVPLAACPPVSAIHTGGQAASGTRYDLVKRALAAAATRRSPGRGRPG